MSISHWRNINSSVKHHSFSFAIVATVSGDEDNDEEHGLCVLTVIVAVLLLADLFSSCCFTPTPAQSGLTTSLLFLLGTCGHTQLPWGYSFCFIPLLLLQHRADRFFGVVCFLPLHLIVSMSSCESRTWWRVTFGLWDACSLLSLLNRAENWATEEKSRCLLQGVTQRGAHNDFNLSLSRSV